MAVAKSIFKSIFRGYARSGFGGDEGNYPDTANLLAWYRTDIIDSKLRSYLPTANHTTQQVKSSGFAGAGSASCTGLLITDTITASGPSDPTCTVNGTLTFPGADCWDIYVHRAGVLWAYWPGINVGSTFEIDASGEGHTLYLTDTAITERVDGTGTMWANDAGFTVADGTTYLDQENTSVIGVGWIIPAMYGNITQSSSWVDGTTREPTEYPGPLGLDAPVTVGTAYPNITITAPLGAEMQALPEFTYNLPVPITSIIPDDNVRVGDRGVLVYDSPLTADEQARADRVVGANPHWNLVSLWNAKDSDGTVSQIGPQPVYSAAGQTPDADGNLVAWPVNHSGKGVMVTPAYANILNTGQHLTTNWPVQSPNVTRSTVVTDGPFGGQIEVGVCNFTSVDQYVISSNIATVEGTVQSAGIWVRGPSGGRTLFKINHLPSDSFSSMTVDTTGVWQFASTTKTIPAGDITSRIQIDQRTFGSAGVGVFQFAHAMLVNSPYLMPACPGGSSVPSTAATSGGNGLAIPLDDRMLTALGAGGQFTHASLVTLIPSSTQVTADANITTVNDAAVGLIYAASGGVLKVTDGTNTATVTVAGGWAANTQILIAVKASGTILQIGYKKSTDAAITWGTAAAYDGSQNPLTHQRFGLNSTIPIGFRQVQTWNKSASDAEILAAMEYAI
jgi:hypothetical protein